MQTSQLPSADDVPQLAQRYPAEPDRPGAGSRRGSPGLPPADEFLARYGDEIDDRVAELLDEREATRPDRRQRPLLMFIGLLVALAATLVLRHNVLAACTVWPSTAIVYLTAAQLATTRR